ncbi:ABC transporter permease [Accumulibacter sp.]|uniref:ABC transporter permease n=1 Tax=Accumulibacter sp. TaxID=2053492 RepID=UPI0025EE8E57|nr:ABC transporter permease [Accumulibacter sp.]MCM8627268.1 ABC transporter permease [Accumulibacter sp.]
MAAGRGFANIVRLGFKELRSLWADKVLLALIVWAFTGAIYAASRGVSQELRLAPVAVVDEDRSPLSVRLIAALTPPYFRPAVPIALTDMDDVLDHGKVSFVILIPANFQRDFLAGRRPTVQVNIDATNMGQSFIGAGYIRSIFTAELDEYLGGTREPRESPIRLVARVRYNPNLTGYWFGGVMEVINMVNMLTIILVGAAFLREREHGTLEHLLVMPLTPFQIIMAKIWANGLAVLTGATIALLVVIRGILEVPIAGSIPLFLCGAAIYLFSAASIGIFLGTIARSMPQFGLLVLLTIIPLQLLSGGVTPRESMPELVQRIMLAAPTTYFVRLAQGILYRGAGLPVVWPDFVAIAGIGAVFFALALMRFRRSVTLTQL